MLCSLFSTMLAARQCHLTKRGHGLQGDQCWYGAMGGGNLLGYGGVSFLSAGLAWPPCFPLPGKGPFQLVVELSQQEKKCVHACCVLCRQGVSK